MNYSYILNFFDYSLNSFLCLHLAIKFTRLKKACTAIYWLSVI